MPSVLIALTVAGFVAATPAGQARYDGDWLFEDYHTGRPFLVKSLGAVGKSAVRVAGTKFTLTNFHNTGVDYSGELRFDPRQPTHVELAFARLDIGPLLGRKGVIEAGPRAGLVRVWGDTLFVAFADHAGGPRPARADDTSAGVTRLVLRRGPAGDPPTQIEVTVTGPDGEPVAGAQVTGNNNHGVVMTYQPLPAAYAALTGIAARRLNRIDAADNPPQLWLSGAKTTNAAGKVRLARHELFDYLLTAYDPAKRHAAFVPVSPADLASGKLLVKLAPCREVFVDVQCPELPADAQHIYNARIYIAGREAGYQAEQAGTRLRFYAPPGDYALYVESHLAAGKSVRLSVPEGDDSFHAPPVELLPNAGARLVGKPAPELKGVTASKGGSVKLSDYKGKYVVLDFWGYWCGPCVRAMPTWMAVHDHFKGQVVVIGIHEDSDGEVPTLNEYEAKIESIRASLWQGRDLPFPVALVSGAERATGPAGQFGVNSYPTSFLIGPDGVLVGQIHAQTPQAAIDFVNAQMRKRVARE